MMTVAADAAGGPRESSFSGCGREQSLVLGRGSEDGELATGHQHCEVFGGRMGWKKGTEDGRMHPQEIHTSTGVVESSRLFNQQSGEAS